MKYLRTYNESIKDYLKPKSKDEMLKSLEKMDAFDKFSNIFKYNLQDNFTKDEIDNIVKELWSSSKIDLGCEFNLVWLVKLAIEEGVDPSKLNNQAIHYAVINDSIDVVKFLLKDERVNPAEDHNCIMTAYGNTNKEMVKLLLNDERVITKLKDEEPERLEKYLNFIKDRN